MLEPAVILLRLAQYAGAAILMGTPLFLIYALPREGPAAGAARPWVRPLLLAAAATVSAGALAGLAAQTAMMAGSLAEGLKPSSLGYVAGETGLGRAALVRAGAGVIAVLLLLAGKPGRGLWFALSALGAVAAAGLAWMGHGAATEGPGGSWHLASDVLHAWAAAVWVGALVAFLALLRDRDRSEEKTRALHRALHGFSGLGSVLVAVLVTTGLVNAGFILGYEGLAGLWTAPYGQLLTVKVAAVLAMLGLAAANRYRHTPALGRALAEGPQQAAAVATLRRSVLLETLLGLSVLALVAWFGTLPPPGGL